MAEPTGSSFISLLGAQVRHEFTASQQYIALAVWFDEHDLPQLARHFYKQSVEEHNHAMMIVQYMLDRDIPVTITGVDDVKNQFSDVREPIRLALEQEQEVTRQIENLFRAAREDGDALGEQFMLWFLKEQVEEVASMRTLLAVAERAGDNLFDIEEFIARETIVEDAAGDPGAPAVAGGRSS
jgi:ferritin